jgi:hypothetical protein
MSEAKEKPRFWYAAPALAWLTLVFFALPWLEVSWQASDQAGKSISQPLLRQSGYQAALGEADGKPMPRAPFLLAFAICLAGVVLAGATLPRGVQRLWLLGGCSLLAGVVLAVQVALGFPLAERVAIVTAEERQRRQQEAENSDEPELPALQFSFVLTYRPWFYLSALASVATLAAVGLEFWEIKDGRR